MKRFLTWAAVGLLVAVAISRWRRANEPGRLIPSGGSVRSAAEQADEPESGVEATPAAERRAEELGVDLSMVKGTGSGGRITVKDVQSAAKER